MWLRSKNRERCKQQCQQALLALEKTPWNKVRDWKNNCLRREMSKRHVMWECILLVLARPILISQGKKLKNRVTLMEVSTWCTFFLGSEWQYQWTHSLAPECIMAFKMREKKIWTVVNITSICECFQLQRSEIRVERTYQLRHSTSHWCKIPVG